jgi:hypothetical protein
MRAKAGAEVSRWWRSAAGAVAARGGGAGRALGLLLLLVPAAAGAAGSGGAGTATAGGAGGAEAKPGAQCPVPPHGVALSRLHDYRRVGELSLFVDGREQPVEIYASESTGVGVLVSPAFKRVLMFSAGSLLAVDAAQLVHRDDGTVELREGAAPGIVGNLEFPAGGAVLFTAEGRKVRLEPQPPLLGLRRAAEVSAHNPEYVARARSYRPDTQAIAALLAERRPVTVRVYYGSWCSHCRKLVPNGLRVEEALAASSIHFEYFGVRTVGEVPRGEAAGAPEIPTAVVAVGGREVGRIAGDAAWQALEVSLRNVLAARAAAKR